jgi:putative transposase
VVYVAFVVDVYSRAIVGWHAATNKRAALVVHALKMALWRRDHTGHAVQKGLIHHSDPGSQDTSFRFTCAARKLGCLRGLGVFVDESIEDSSPSDSRGAEVDDRRRRRVGVWRTLFAGLM